MIQHSVHFSSFLKSPLIEYLQLERDMFSVEDLRWHPQMTVQEYMRQAEQCGYQSTELARVRDVIVRMQQCNATTILSFTSNMVSAGLRGLFAQLIELGVVDAVVTTAGAIEEDIMKATGAEFHIGQFAADDVALHERGMNRIGNILIPNEYYAQFEHWMQPTLTELYEQGARWSIPDLLRHVGQKLDDTCSILYQAASTEVPVFCPALTDGAIGFHLHLFQQEHTDFVVDPVADFGQLLSLTSPDERLGVIALGGSVAKHYAILGTLLHGGANYAAYITTARPTSGSMSGATTNEAKSWGKVEDEADVATAHGDATILFPLAIYSALDTLHDEGLLT